MANIGKGVGKALLKSMKIFGLRPDDIIEMLTEFELDSFIADEIKEIEKKDGVEHIAIVGQINENNKLIFTAIDNQNLAHEINFFGVKKQSFGITDLLKELVTLAFSSIEKDKKKKGKKSKKVKK